MKQRARGCDVLSCRNLGSTALSMSEGRAGPSNRTARVTFSELHPVHAYAWVGGRGRGASRCCHGTVPMGWASHVPAAYLSSPAMPIWSYCSSCGMLVGRSPQSFAPTRGPLQDPKKQCGILQLPDRATGIPGLGASA